MIIQYVQECMELMIVCALILKRTHENLYAGDGGRIELILLEKLIAFLEFVLTYYLNVKKLFKYLGTN